MSSISNIMGLSNVDALEAVYGNRKKQARAGWGEATALGDRVSISDAARQLLNMASETANNESAESAQVQTWAEREERSKFAEELRTQLVRQGYSQYMTEDERQAVMEAVMGNASGQSAGVGGSRNSGAQVESALLQASATSGSMAQSLGAVNLSVEADGDGQVEASGQGLAFGAGSASSAGDIDAKIAKLQQKIEIFYL